MKIAEEFFMAMWRWLALLVDLLDTRNNPEPQPDHSQKDAHWCESSRQKAFFGRNQGSVAEGKVSPFNISFLLQYIYTIFSK